MNRPIFILGLGRSGTTWVSDIISKYSGGLILFEPFHPQIFLSHPQYLYREHIKCDALINHIRTVLDKKNQSTWLLRNHLNVDINQVDDLFISELWKESQIIGVKSIRLNSSFAEIASFFEAQVIFIIRHPLAVISSIMNRPNFWEDISWKTHWRLLINSINNTEILLIQKCCKSYIQKLAFYWAYLNSLALKQLSTLQIDPIFYEDLYKNPFNKAKALLESLHIYDHNIHPAHLFTPSMVTLRTLHSKYYTKITSDQNSLDFFWKESLSPEQIYEIIDIINKVCDIDHRLGQMCTDQNYLHAL